MRKMISQAVLKKANRKDGLGLDIRFGPVVGSSGPGLRPMCAFLRAVESEKGWSPRVYVDDQGSIRLRIDSIITDTIQGLNFRGIVRTWAKGDGVDDSVLAYYISAGGCGYDMLAASTRGIKVYDNNDNLVEIGDHCDGKGRPTLDAFVQAQGWRQVV
jgi:hypothetical protein